jgi:recombination protein RecA
MLAAASLRTQIEAALAHRIPSALTPASRIIRELVSTGVPAVDQLLHGGFPVGAVTEIVGAECSGRTSLALSFISVMTRADKVCAWVDVSDTLNPESAAAAGIDLRRLLWARCGSFSKAGIPPQAPAAFTVPEKYFAPRPITKGLHGGGFGPHPRGEVKGVARAITGLLRPAPSSPLSTARVLESKSANTVVVAATPQSFVKSTKAPISTKSFLSKPFSSKPWSRLDQALRVTDLLLQNGGFGAIVLDLGGIAPEHVLRIPLATWFRYRSVAEQKQTSVLLLSQHACAKSSASLQLHLQSGHTLDEGATVFSGTEHFIEVTRERFPPSSVNVTSLRKPAQSQNHGYWRTTTAWTGR